MPRLVLSRDNSEVFAIEALGEKTFGPGVPTLSIYRICRSAPCPNREG